MIIYSLSYNKHPVVRPERISIHILQKYTVTLSYYFLYLLLKYFQNTLLIRITKEALNHIILSFSRPHTYLVQLYRSRSKCNAQLPLQPISAAPLFHLCVSRSRIRLTIMYVAAISPRAAFNQ